MIKMRNQIRYALILLTITLLPLLRAQSQTFIVKGNVSTDSTVVKYASVTFIDQSDNTKRYSTITDTSGNYQLNIITEVNEESIIPQTIELLQNYPNPFSSGTEIPYKLNKQTDVSIKIYNILGQEVKTFRVGMQANGIYSVLWDGRNNFGNKVTPGIYFYQLQVGNETLVKKMIYSGSSASLGIQNSSGFFYKAKSSLKPSKKFYLGTMTYTVEIINADSTKPWIRRKEVSALIIQSDTTLNFFVEEEIHERYLLYIGFENTYIQVYDTELHAFVDSLGGFNEYTWDIETTKSSSKLYVCTRESPNYPPYVYSVNLQTKERKEILSKKAEIFLSPNGIPFIIAWNSFDSLRQVGIIDTLSDHIEWIDTLDMLANTMSNDQSLVFGPIETVFYSLTSHFKLFKYNYQTKEVLYTYKSTPNFRMVIDQGGKFIYSAGGPAIDLEKDSLVGLFKLFCDPEADFNGTLALSPGGESLYATDVGKPLLPEPIPCGAVAIFYSLPQGGSGNMSFIDVKSVAYLYNTSWQTDKIVITDDGKKAFVSNWVDLIYVIDLEEEIVSDVIKLKWYLPRTLALVPK